MRASPATARTRAWHRVGHRERLLSNYAPAIQAANALQRASHSVPRHISVYASASRPGVTQIGRDDRRIVDRCVVASAHFTGLVGTRVECGRPAVMAGGSAHGQGVSARFALLARPLRVHCNHLVGSTSDRRSRCAARRAFALTYYCHRNRRGIEIVQKKCARCHHSEPPTGFTLAARQSQTCLLRFCISSRHTKHYLTSA
jgi:hypothetical protein